MIIIIKLTLTTQLRAKGRSTAPVQCYGDRGRRQLDGAGAPNATRKRALKYKFGEIPIARKWESLGRGNFKETRITRKRESPDTEITRKQEHRKRNGRCQVNQQEHSD